MFKLSFTVLRDTQRSGDVLMHIGNKQIKPRGQRQKNNEVKHSHDSFIWQIHNWLYSERFLGYVL